MGRDQSDSKLQKRKQQENKGTAETEWRESRHVQDRRLVVLDSMSLR